MHASHGRDALGWTMARTSGLLLGQDAVDAVLGLLTATALHTVPTATGAGITTSAPDGSRTTVVGTDRTVLAADALQYELDEGPCLTAWRDRRTVRVDDVAHDERWPRWGPAARGLGVASSLSAPLVAADSAVGAIKLYAAGESAFTVEEEATTAMFAAQAGVLLAAAEGFRRGGDLGADLREVLRRRDLVARATGFLMGQDGVSEDAAFTHLLALARRDQRGVHDTAAELLGARPRGR
ncbi:GAF domain-containing protein [Cellulomonas sp. JZ18]|uniref:GAF and ANTAR domain-containing protein n=1 Tax=Cellulomonas sp. JZ18 TaxID=2654191 RepID=UPI0012D4B086|nr:GAF and ANTAR domain-containing protein [Cellulomonas sp. JZ18]QGQ18819.1 GAF domain-containing protein [Cellulomonas sp. JZ18]